MEGRQNRQRLTVIAITYCLRVLYVDIWGSYDLHHISKRNSSRSAAGTGGGGRFDVRDSVVMGITFGTQLFGRIHVEMSNEPERQCGGPAILIAEGVDS